MNSNALNKVMVRIEERLARSPSPAVRMPGLWINPEGPVAAQSVVPEQFFRDRLLAILATPPQKRVTDGNVPGDWGKNAIAYNLLVRYGAAFDHDGDGKISCEPLASGWRETGTFLKAIAMLPFIRSLGCNVIHLLPITSIGQDGNKGDMGSAFAIRDPYALDEHLAEPALGLDVETEFAAFVEAAHHLGIRVVVEFVFRTAAKDAAWAQEHPEWFYWIRADVPDRQNGEKSEATYGAPIFTADELKRIYDAVGNGRFNELLPPHQIYLDMFTAPPAPATLRMENGCWRGTAPDPRNGQPVTVRIPGAFCDWGPDSEQPPWTDVTYLRLYDHPDFNYMAYNTVRMYANQFARPENVVRPLWNKITEVIPHYQTHYRVDGVMIDMGHALPGDLKRQLVARARQIDPDFALWAEEFNLTPAAREEGYNVCVGPFMETMRDPERFRGWIRWIHGAGLPVPFMAMAENHNTPRAVHWDGGAAYALYAQALGAFLPGVPYLHNGIELAEPVPVNTGFGFTNEEVAKLPPAVLPLFSAAAMDWTRKGTLVADLRRVHALRAQHQELFSDPTPGAVIPLETSNRAILGYIRQKPGAKTGFAILGNSDMHQAQPLTLPHPSATIDLISGQPLPATLRPAQVVAYAI
jgi:starch synthase (maltosyl-transferring)